MAYPRNVGHRESHSIHTGDREAFEQHRTLLEELAGHTMFLPWDEALAFATVLHAHAFAAMVTFFEAVDFAGDQARLDASCTLPNPCMHKGPGPGLRRGVSGLAARGINRRWRSGHRSHYQVFRPRERGRAIAARYKPLGSNPKTTAIKNRWRMICADLVFYWPS